MSRSKYPYLATPKERLSALDNLVHYAEIVAKDAGSTPTHKLTRKQELALNSALRSLDSYSEYMVGRQLCRAFGIERDNGRKD